MVRAAIYLQLLEHFPAELVLRQHSPHRFLDHPLGLFGTHETRRALLETTGILRVVAVDLVALFFSGEDDFLGIDDDHMIAGIEKGRVDRLVLAGQDPRDRRRKTAEDFSFGVADEPARFDVTLLGEVRTHESPEISVDQLSEDNDNSLQHKELHTSPGTGKKR